jgi:carbon-monoxide dehydrogenase medium subunit
MFVSFYENALEPHELLTWISVPAIRPGQGWGFVEYAHQQGDYGLAGAGALITLDDDGLVGDVRAAVLSAADRPLLFTQTVGARPDAALWEELAHTWADQTDPAADDRDYAQRLCAAALAEALVAAEGRARQEELSDARL